MKKIFFTMLLSSVFSLSMMAQATRTIKGAVIDKNGNPLPGALVEATGGAENTTVDADGTFSMEVPIWLKSATAKYAGMKDKKMKVTSSDMIFTMKEGHAGDWFINGIGSYVYPTKAHVFRVGVMGGKLAKWGYYGKFMLTVGDNFDDAGVPTGSVGVIKSITENEDAFSMYTYLGAGYAPVIHKENKGYYTVYHSHDGEIFDLGLIFNYKFVNLNVGYSVATNFEKINNELVVGIGCRF